MRPTQFILNRFFYDTKETSSHHMHSHIPKATRRCIALHTYAEWHEEKKHEKTYRIMNRTKQEGIYRERNFCSRAHRHLAPLNHCETKWIEMLTWNGIKKKKENLLTIQKILQLKLQYCVLMCAIPFAYISNLLSLSIVHSPTRSFFNAFLHVYLYTYISCIVLMLAQICRPFDNNNNSRRKECVMNNE